MIQKFNAPCNFNGMVSPFAFWVSDEYLAGKDPLLFQKNWLQEARGGTLDPKISEGIIEIARIAEQNKLSFEYLFGIAMNAALEKYNQPVTAATQEENLNLSNPDNEEDDEYDEIEEEEDFDDGEENDSINISFD